MNDGDKDIQDIVQEFLSCTAAVERLVAGRSPELLVRRREGGGWSVVECIEHLNISTRASLPTIARAVAQGRAQGLLGPGPYKMDFVGRMLRRSLEPPARIRVKTPAAFIPPPGLSPESVLGDFHTLQDRLVDAVRSSDGLKLDAITIRSVFEKRVRYNLFAAYLILAAHERRHIWQAEQALAGGEQENHT